MNINTNDIIIKYTTIRKDIKFKRIMFGGVINRRLTIDEIVGIHNTSMKNIISQNEKIMLSRLFPAVIICESTLGAKTYVELDHLERRAKTKDNGEL